MYFWDSFSLSLQAQTPPITHRDLKVENLLISESGVIKLCDFGSAMTKTYEIDLGWSAHQRAMLEDEVRALINHMSCTPWISLASMYSSSSNVGKRICEDESKLQYYPFSFLA